MLDYDTEADRYDRTRGGRPRARAAAAAVHELIRENLIMETPVTDALVVDCAGGTAIVTAELAGLGHRVLVIDRSPGMLQHAVTRLPHRALCADATAAPIVDGGCAAVLTVWLLHLLDDVTEVVAEAARLLVPGGLYLTTVDKEAAAGRPRPAHRSPADAPDRVDAVCADHGLVRVAETTFVGHGQADPGATDPVYRLVAYRKA